MHKPDQAIKYWKQSQNINEIVNFLWANEHFIKVNEECFSKKCCTLVSQVLIKQLFLITSNLAFACRLSKVKTYPRTTTRSKIVKHRYFIFDVWSFVPRSLDNEWGRVSSEDEKRVCSRWTRLQCEHIFKYFSVPWGSEWSEWASLWTERANEASAAKQNAAEQVSRVSGAITQT